MVCVIDLCGEEDVILAAAEPEEPKASPALPPAFVPQLALQIVPVENDES